VLKIIVGCFLSTVVFAQAPQWDAFTATGRDIDWRTLPVVQPQTPPVHGGFVSIQTLRIPSKALSAFQDSMRLSREGRREKAIEKLRRAIQIYPEFWQAHSNLGTYLYLSGHVEQAAQAFQHAIEIGPISALTQTNLAAALLSLNRVVEAEQVVRRALELDPKYIKAQYVYSLVLVAPRPVNAQNQ